ncbi:MAG TPA: hypothetical protein VJR06_04620, partial [Nitrososphaerales archaeon]|nr:hypothetical protein [Nitrososphaerales archaeon]
AFEVACGRRGFKVRPLVSQKLFFEVLSVYEATSAEGSFRLDEDSGTGAGYGETSTARRLHQVPASPS